MTRAVLTPAVAALLLCVLALTSPSALSTAAERVRVDVDLFIPALQQLEVSSRIVAFPSPTPAHFAAGYLELPEPIVLTIHSNVPWQLWVRSAAQAPESSKGRVIEAPTIECRVGNRPYMALTAEWTAVASVDHAVRGEQLELAVRIPMRWSAMTPGDYQPKLEYMLASARE